jgi:hypothetical protein
MPNKRSIGGIAAQVTISETERDDLFITEHPVEVGAPISDHAYKRPSEVTIRAGWSTAKTGDLSANGNGMYGILLSWQAALNPFDLYTGKRTYHNMLISGLSVQTDQHSEFALMAEITCKQIIRVSTSATQAALSANPDNQASPENNATTQNHGDQQPRPADSNNGSGGGAGQNGSFGAGGEYGVVQTGQPAAVATVTPEEKALGTQMRLNADATTIEKSAIYAPEFLQ